MTNEANPIAPPDLQGEHYLTVIKRLHENLSPRTYLEIGVDKGDTLCLSTCPSIGIDPVFRIIDRACFKQPILGLYQMTSDEFFAKHSPTDILGDLVDMAFLDGMHRCEFLLRDFMNTERYCRRNSLILLHDCLPVEAAMATRAETAGRLQMLAPHREGWWTGDVWRTALLLKRRRPNLRITALDASGTGLVIVTNLDPSNECLALDYASHVEEMMSWDLNKLGVDAYFDELGVISTEYLRQHENITERFWL